MHLLLVLLLAAAAFIDEVYAASLAPEPAPQLSATNFAFPTFGTQSCSSSSNLLCSGNVTEGNGFLSLKQDRSPLPGLQGANNDGKVLYRHPVDASPAVFSTTFTYRIVGVSNSPPILSIDGFTFIMVPDVSAGSTLGIMGQANTDAASDISRATVDLNTYEVDNGGNYISLTTNIFGVELKSLKDIKVRIDYNGLRKWIEVYAAFESDPLVQIFSSQFDIAVTFPNFMYVGFVAATGSHQLLNWEFKSSINWN